MVPTPPLHRNYPAKCHRQKTCEHHIRTHGGVRSVLVLLKPSAALRDLLSELCPVPGVRLASRPLSLPVVCRMRSSAPLVTRSAVTVLPWTRGGQAAADRTFLRSCPPRAWLVRPQHSHLEERRCRLVLHGRGLDRPGSPVPPAWPLSTVSAWSVAPSLPLLPSLSIRPTGGAAWWVARPQRHPVRSTLPGKQTWGSTPYCLLVLHRFLAAGGV